MSEIRNIQVGWFKYFQDIEEIRLDGKHLLLYGENGSGKSSLSYSLYTLIEAANKQASYVQKYFVPYDQSESSLLNIFADTSNGVENTGAIIRVEDTDDNIYQLAYDKTDVCGDDALIESSKASDFVNYQSLFRFQMFKNSEDAQLRAVFEYSILPYIYFPRISYKGKDFSCARDIFFQYRHVGLGKTTNPKGDVILEYKSSPAYDEFVKLEKHFNKEMQRLIDFINEHVNEYIKTLKYNFEVMLDYKKAAHHKRDKYMDYFEYGIELVMTKYEGHKVNIKHPNTFLNEAKMAALAFSIRLSVLDYRIQQSVAQNAMKILVLDDIMISLDMGNRDVMSDLIVNDLAKRFQILFFTHEKSMFEALKQKITLAKANESKPMRAWEFLEMYDAKGKPCVQPYREPIARAWEYFNGGSTGVDYNACGNALRQAMEKALANILAKINGIDKNSEAADDKHIMLSEYISIATSQFEKKGLKTELLKDLQGLTTFLLNPTSHYNPSSNFYKRELEKAFEIYDKLVKIDAKVVVAQGERFELTVVSMDGKMLRYEILALQDILACKDFDMTSFSLSAESYMFKVKEIGKDDSALKGETRSLQGLYNYAQRICEHHIGMVDEAISLEDAYVYQEKPFRQIMNEM